MKTKSAMLTNVVDYCLRRFRRKQSSSLARLRVDVLLRPSVLAGLDPRHVVAGKK